MVFSADIFVNPTLEDNYPTTNLEAIACGTPVITFNTGGSLESAIFYGKVVNKNIDELIRAIKEQSFKKIDIEISIENMINQYIEII